MIFKIVINSIIVILEIANQFNLLNLLKYLQPHHLESLEWLKQLVMADQWWF